MDSSKKFVNPSPETKANILSKLFFCWVIPFFKYGYSKNLEPADIYSSTTANSSVTLGDLLEKHWRNELVKAKNSHRKPSLQRAIFNAFWKPYMIYGLYILIQIICIRCMSPIILSQYIHFFEERKEFYEIGPWTLSSTIYSFILAATVVLLAFLNMIIFHYSSFNCQRVGVRVRIACSSLVYRKVLKLSQASLGQTTTGHLVNLLSNDVRRFDTASIYLHYIWIMPILFVSSAYIMVMNVGLATIAAMAFIFIQAIPVQGYLSKLQGKFRSKIAPLTDYRVKIMNEVITGIQVIKMYAWEKPFEKLVEKSREREIKYITKTSYLRGFSLAQSITTERLALYITIISHVLLGNRPTSEIVFPMAQLINIMQHYIGIFFPFGIAFYSEVKVTMKRLEYILLLEENHSPPLNDVIDMDDKMGTINIKNATASWSSDPIVQTLRNINLNIPQGSLCCVVGNVGSGKSSLLQILLKELSPREGHIEVRGKISFACQEPWLFVSNVRSNILFGKPFLKDRYNSVVDVCALKKDFQQFPYADRTLVGERGVSLSGGQRARINLARAVYTEADIYLFDDPLSAVDTHVGKNIFEKCIKNYLNGKTRILVTHQWRFLEHADMIIVMDNGEIVDVAPLHQLSKEVLANIKLQESSSDEDTPEENNFQLERHKSIASIANSLEQEEEREEPKETEELMEKGKLSAALYVEYYRSGSSTCLLIFMVVILVIAQVFCNFCDLWVTYWTNEESKFFLSLNSSDNSFTVTPLLENQTLDRNNTFDTEKIMPTQNNFLIIYSILISITFIVITGRAILLYKVCMNSSKGLHKKMFSHILNAPMRFFNTNPSGRILNRFSNDMGAVDELLPFAKLLSIQIMLLLIGIMVMNFMVNIWMLIPVIILGILFHYVRVFYLASAQDVKRIEGITKGPVFSHLSATVQGIPTIRSSNAQEMLIEEFDTLQDQHTSSSFLFLACSETFGIYLDSISVAFLAIVTFQFLFVEGDLDSGYVGLTITSSLILIGMLQMGVRQATEVSANMTSVERLIQYTKLPKEEDSNQLAMKAPSNWPQNGKITFKNTCVRYSLEEPPVLKNLNITIEAGEKVGVVGRTGAGKTTIVASLFRLVIVEGSILIDDIDTQKICLKDLRSRISVIPQEPILFSSSVRQNLDPFDKSSDNEIWQALADVELKEAISSLDQKMNEGGSNFSIGQRQLFCLARAILRKNKILVMDEATANVDPNTDALIQRTIRRKFKDCTVLTIAHRLNTIMDSDKVLVMDAGEAVEYAHPHELLQLPDGYLNKMATKCGPSLEAQLRKTAKNSYKTS